MVIEESLQTHFEHLLQEVLIYAHNTLLPYSGVLTFYLIG